MPAVDRRQRGAEAEWIAESFLAARGLKVLARNFRCAGGELDLVCSEQTDTRQELVVVEVRLRTSAGYGSGADSVDRRKQRRLVRASLHFLAEHPEYAQLPLRYDIVELRSTRPGAQGLRWLQAAFVPED